MKTNRASKVSAERLAKMDNYELPAHMELDYSKAKPNRFAKYENHVRVVRVNIPTILTPTSEPKERHSVTLYRWQVKELRKLDPNLSRAIRKLLAAIPSR